MITKKGHCGTLHCEGVEAYISIDDRDVVVRGDVSLPAVLDHHAFDRGETVLREAHLDGGPYENDVEVDSWTDEEVQRAKYALFEAAVDELRRAS